MITVTFHGYRKDDHLPETVDVGGVPWRVVNGVLAAPGAAVKIEEQEQDLRRERFISAILEMVSKAVEELKRNV